MKGICEYWLEDCVLRCFCVFVIMVNKCKIKVIVILKEVVYWEMIKSSMNFFLYFLSKSVYLNN